MQKKLLIIIVAIMTLVAVGMVTYMLYSQPASAPKVTNRSIADCSETTRSWRTSPQIDNETMSRGEIVDIRYGQHDCFDRIVFEINSGDLVGYRAEYVSAVIGGGSGEPVEVAGNSLIQLTINAPATSDPHPTDFGPTQDWNALHQIKRVSSFEGVTTYGIGVNKETPFRIFHLPGKDGERMRVVLDLAH